MQEDTKYRPSLRLDMNLFEICTKYAADHPVYAHVAILGIFATAQRMVR